MLSNGELESSSVGSRRLISHIWSRKILWLSLAVVGLLAGLAFVSVRKSHYLSEASIFVVQESMGVGLAEAADIAIPSFRQNSNKDYVFALVDSDWMRREILSRIEKARPGLFWTHVGKSAKDQAVEAGLKRLKKLVVVKTSPKDPISIRVRSTNPELSFLVAEIALETLTARLEADLQREEDFVSGQLAKVSAHLKKAEDDLARYQMSVGLAAPPEHQSKEEFSNFARLSQELFDAEAGYLALNRRLDAPGDLATGLQLSAEKEGYIARLTYLRQMIGQQQKALKDFPKQSLELNRLQRNLTLDQQSLIGLTRSLEDARMRRERALVPFRVIDRPYLNTIPDDLSPVIIVCAGLLLGLVAGLLWALLELL